MNEEHSQLVRYVKAILGKIGDTLVVADMHKKVVGKEVRKIHIER